MSLALPAARRPAAAVLIALCLLGFSGPGWATPLAAIQAPVRPDLEEVRLSPDDSLLAHHGGGGASASQLLTTGVSSGGGAVSDSLWGNMLLNMAYSRDDVIQEAMKKLGRVNVLTFLGVAAATGLDLAQSVTTLATLNQGESHHDAGGEGEHHAHHDSAAPAIMGIVGSGITLATLGGQTVMIKRYERRISERQKVIVDQVSHILSDLEQGAEDAHVRPELAGLVGDRATGEFLQLWHVVHPVSP